MFKAELLTSNPVCPFPNLPHLEYQSLQSFLLKTSVLLSVFYTPRLDCQLILRLLLSKYTLVTNNWLIWLTTRLPWWSKPLSSLAWMIPEATWSPCFWSYPLQSILNSSSQSDSVKTQVRSREPSAQKPPWAAHLRVMRSPADLAFVSSLTLSPSPQLPPLQPCWAL